MMTYAQARRFAQEASKSGSVLGLASIRALMSELDNVQEALPIIHLAAILNTNHIYSISRNLTASSTVTFAGTHKQVFVSRYYYKPLISKLEEKRLHQ